MKNSSYARPINHRINLIMGINAMCMERVMIDGNLELGKSAEITGNVKARDVILGPGSVIFGDLTAEGDLTALDGAKVSGHVKILGAAFIRPGVAFGSLDVGGLIELQGKPPSKHIKGKMVVSDEEDYRDNAKQKSETEAFKKPRPEEKRVIQPPKVPVKAPPANANAHGGKLPPAQKTAQNKAKHVEEKPKKRGFFGLFK